MRCRIQIHRIIAALVTQYHENLTVGIELLAFIQSLQLPRLIVRFKGCLYGTPQGDSAAVLSTGARDDQINNFGRSRVLKRERISHTVALTFGSACRYNCVVRAGVFPT